MIGSLLSRDCRTSDIEQRRERQKERNRVKIEEGDGRGGKGEKGTIKVTLHRVAASVLGRDGTAVSEGGEVGRQRRMEERGKGKK
jgi:hypothetical protein